MQSDADVPGEDQGSGKGSRQRPKSSLETELNQALDRLDHQVEDTKNYLASLDKQEQTISTRKRRKREPKPDSSSER